jgi:hypothetical protein
MKRTTIFIPETLERDLQLYARREGKAVASVVREAVEQYLTNAQATGVLPSFAGVGASGHRDIADRHEAILFDELQPHDDGVAVKASRYTRPTRARRSTPRRRR